MILEIITIWLLTILSMAIGYFLHTQTKEKNIIKTAIEEYKKKKDLEDIGPVMRPTQEQILENENPTIRDGKKEFAKFLNKLIPKK